MLKQIITIIDNGLKVIIYVKKKFDEMWKNRTAGKIRRAVDNNDVDALDKFMHDVEEKRKKRQN